MGKFRENNHLLQQKQVLARGSIPTTEYVNIPEEIETLLSEYDEYHNDWINRVKSYYKSDEGRTAESLHPSMMKIVI